MSKSIHCKRIPKEFIVDLNLAKQYFSDFGRIRQLLTQPGASCTVEYETAEEARRALHESGFYKGKTFIVQSGKTVDSFDPAVQEELDMMSGGSAKMPSRLPPKPSRTQLPLLQTNYVKKAQPAAVEAEPPKSPVMIHKMSVSELQKLVSSPALTSDQKYRALECRDKLTRIQRGQTTDITKAKSTKGACPDMCPEKERWMREAKHQIASFEMTSHSRHQIDHRLAVKQYSRSSADQEMPLPCELRAEPVLRMTMMYLLHEIADLCDTSDVGVSDWFHFLWDRTRSIRKEITQQELCCQGSVRLVEQCARFHIHCAGRLIAEEPQVFDQKINTENLTKCLQSLKYMYHDLRLKGEHCRNEGEFRAYIILLNLQDSNFLWEVKQLPVSIQQSAEVRFGIDVFKALEQNNYVKFFKLVRRTTYLNACILLRYFNQVRGRALATVTKAYSIKSAVPLSLSSLSYTLAFEDDQGAAQFFEYYGLSCDSQRVFVDRGTFYYPDLPYIMDRAINVVEQKRHISVGAVIAGGEEHLAPKTIYSNHVPENSFDSRGYLKTSTDINVEEEEEGKTEGMEDGRHGTRKAWKTEGMELGRHGTRKAWKRDIEFIFIEEDMDEEEAPEEVDHIFKKPSPVAGSSMFRGSMKSPSTPLSSHSSIFKFHVENQPSLPPSGFSFAKLMTENMTNSSQQIPFPKAIDQSGKSIFKIQSPSTGGFSFTNSPSHQLSTPKTPEIKSTSGVIPAEESLADIQRLAGHSTESLITQVCKEMIKSNAEKELRNYSQLLADCRRCEDSLTAGVVRELIAELYREECLDYHIGIYYRQKMLKKAFSGWRKRTATNRENRDRTQMTPMWIPSIPLESQKMELMSEHQKSALCDLARYRLGQANSPLLIAPQQDKVDIEKQIGTQLAQKFPQHSQLLFNIAISIPGPDEGAFGCCEFLQKWFKEYLNVSVDPRKPLMITEVSPNGYQTVGICIRLLIGCECKQEDENSLQKSDENLDGVLFYMSENLSNSQRRRFKLVMDKFRRNDVPVTVYNMHGFMAEERIMDQLGLEEDHRVGAVLVDPKTEKRHMKESLREGIKFLVDNYSRPNDHLRSIQLINLVTSTVGETLWMRLAINSNVNAATDEILRHGQVVAEIYNEGVDRVIDLCCGDYSSCVDVPKELQPFVRRNYSTATSNNYTHFPSDWRSSGRREVIKSFLRSIKLSQFPEIRIVGESFEPIDLLQDNLRRLFGGDQNIVRNIIFQMMQCLRSENNWVRPMQVLTRELLVHKLRQARDLPETVVYDEARFLNYQDTPWWLQSTVLKRRFEIVPDADESDSKKRKVSSMDSSLSSEGLDDILNRANKCVERANRITLNFKQNQDALNSISSKYDEKLTRLMTYEDVL